MVSGSGAGELPPPAGADIRMLVRNGRVVPVREDTVLHAGDHAHLPSEPGQAAAVELPFGLREGG